MRRSARLTAFGVLRDARRALRGGRAAVEARQRERLAALLQHARAHSAFYAELYAGLPQHPDLGSLPPVTKAQLMGHFDAWVTDPEVTKDALLRFTARQDTIGTDFLGRYVVFTTSGSTGEPTLLVQDARALAVMNGLAYGRPPYISRQVLLRMLAKGIRGAAVFASGGHFLTAVMYTRRIRSVPLRRRYVRFFSVLEPVAQLVEELNAYRPAMLESYASGLEVLAEEQAAGRLRVAPALVACGGEQLLPAVRRRIEEVFGCPLLELYSASEASPLALPCRYGEQHVNADWFILEPIDSAGRPVPGGGALALGAADQPGQLRPADHPLRARRLRAPRCAAVPLREPPAHRPHRGPHRRGPPVRGTRGHRGPAAHGPGHGRGGDPRRAPVPGAADGSGRPGRPRRGPARARAALGGGGGACATALPPR
ncbi:hypothetical protein J2W20_000591 [Sinomonas atrocyanea]|uniref:AMP-binding protein n=1 Tax=Sinomonas atrocyanea TaxID=37927 RepID=UPI00278990DA|nr:AMP-binding protein [Sinomonas atrocyanea]MDQ0258716.1 hypothetical protein [Sinomonas atrocyanea]